MLLRIYSFLLVVASVMALAVRVMAEADGPDFYDVKDVAANDVLNIRVQADSQSSKVGEIPPDGKCLRNLGCVGGLTFEEFSTLSEEEKRKLERQRPRWCQIEYNGVKGWVAGRYLQESAGQCQP